MLAPSSSTDPDRAAEGTSSCIRFRIRRNVDFPQPDGPMSAVTLPGSMVSEIRSRTLLEPNQAPTLVARSPDWEVPGIGAVPMTAGGTDGAGYRGPWNCCVDVM